VFEKDIMKLKKGQVIKFIIPESSEEEFEAEIYLIGNTIDDSRTVKRVKPLINGKGWEYEVLLDSNLEVKRALGAATVPLTLLVKDGKIVYRHSGYTPGAENELYDYIQKHSK